MSGEARTLRRGLRAGLGYGLAAAILETAVSGIQMRILHLPPLTVPQIKASILTILFGAALGLALAPLGRLHARAVPAALLSLWLVANYVLAINPEAPGFWAAPPLIAALLWGLAIRLSRSWPRATLGLSVGSLLVALAVPPLLERLRPPAPPIAGVQAAPGAPDVVVVVIDTVRSSSMSAYGYSRPTTPVFDALVPDGVLFEDAWAPSTWSLPSHGTMFTGLFPSVHLAHDETRSLGPEIPVLAEVFAQNGYDTRCFTANPHISEGFGLSRGFASSDQAFLQGDGSRAFFFAFRVLDELGWSASDKGGGVVAGHVEDWVRARSADAPPAFVFVNFLEAHFPFHQLPPEYLHKFTTRSDAELVDASTLAFSAMFGRGLSAAESEAIRAPMTDLYDAGVAYTDSLLGRVVEALKAGGRWDNTVLVVLSDHGEMVGENGVYGHISAIYEPVLRVPLWVRAPGLTAARVSQPVSTAGVYATVLELARLAPPAPVHVGSLLASSGPSLGLPLIAERYKSTMLGEASTDPMANVDLRVRAYRVGDWKLVETSDGRAMLYDLTADPGETRDLAAADPDTLAQMQSELRLWEAKLGLPALNAPVETVARPELDPVVEERLKALGYVD